MSDFVLREVERIDNFEVVGTDMPDVALNETENVALPGNFENILTNSCVDIDVSCSNSTSTINVLPVTSTSNCNSNGLSSRVANAICIVLGEISPLLQRYDSGKQYSKGCKRKR